jgi:hypothetical protein
MSATVYLAGPIQHAADHGVGWRERLKDEDINHEGNIEWIDPMDKYNTHEMEYREWTSEDIVREDLEIISDCDAVLVHWIEVPTCGTPMEVFFANRFPKLAQMVEELAERASENGGKSAPSSTAQIIETAEYANLDPWMVDVLANINKDVPVIVQTRVPAEEISPWLTSHADAMVESFVEAAHWIENNVNGGSAPEADLLKPEYDLVSA